MKLLSIIFILAFGLSAFGQKTVADLQPSHAIALEKFLSANKSFGFMSENFIDKNFGEKYLADMRKYFKKPLKPYYIVGDFNKDKITDFALILTREIPPKKAEDGDYFIYSLTVAIFNGSKKGTFTKAFSKNVEVPLNCFLNVESKQLYFGVFETDADTMIFTPVGKGYIIEFPEEG
jgi:hypothetical protein